MDTVFVQYMDTFCSWINVHVHTPYILVLERSLPILALSLSLDNAPPATPESALARGLLLNPAAEQSARAPPAAPQRLAAARASDATRSARPARQTAPGNAVQHRPTRQAAPSYSHRVAGYYSRIPLYPCITICFG